MNLKKLFLSLIKIIPKIEPRPAQQILAIMAMAVAIHAGQAKAEQYDKSLHFTGAYAATLTTYLVCRKLEIPKTQSYLLSFAVVSLLGIFKEYAIDANPDPQDILHNQIGATTAIGMSLLFDF
jgi:hypothetical protein